MNIKQRFIKTAKFLIPVTLAYIFFCFICILILVIIFDNDNAETNPAEQGRSRSVNYYIKQQNKDYENIYELDCIPGSDARILGNDYDLLGKLVNLERIKLVGIADEEDAQNFFAELSKLKKLTTVEIEASHVGMIEKLGEIENLKNLSIIGSSGGGVWFQIKDLDLLGTDSRFDKLQSLTLKYIEMEAIPDLSGLSELRELSVSGREIKEIDPDSVNWENLISLEIKNTSVTDIDDSIVERLNDLRSFDISYSRIGDVDFILDLPNLQDFSYIGHDYSNVDLECIKEHPNYNKKWG